MRKSRTFEVDRSEAKLMGVCAGLARHTGVDPTIIRIGFVVATIVGGFPWTVLGYLLLGLIGQPGRARRRRSEGIAADERGPELDRRMADIETYVAGSNSRLAREIEELR
ncbi:MAG: PspC domain-containing protein [Pseudomonadota bacterium]|nr:PspC domain-containing protein [Pseudomonadota bacterium]